MSYLKMRLNYDCNTNLPKVRVISMKIIIVGVEPFSLLNFRGDLISRLSEEGFSVIAVASGASQKDIREIEKLGCRYHDIKINRVGISPISDIILLIKLIIFISSEKPSYLMAYTIKPVIWSGIALYFFPLIKFIPIITGLGYAFGEGGLKRSAVNIFARNLYALSMRRANSLIFQNMPNKKLFIEKGILKDPSKSVVIEGSGVNLEKFPYISPRINKTNLRFLMMARLLRDKGIYEYLNAAQEIKLAYPNVEFVLAGPTDNSPNAIDRRYLNFFEDNEIINYLGPVKDVKRIISGTDVFVLPSYHEGMPRTVIEAMAIGRPIITTDTSGCQETVHNGINGWLVPIKREDLLVERMLWFIKKPEKITKMGVQSRHLAERKFDVHHINEKIMDVIRNA